MSTQTANLSAEGEALKWQALQDLQSARALIYRAREHMSKLEGVGYCAAYEKLLDHDDKLDAFIRKYRGLKPPTGVFRV
jgi:hypothetical protein